MLEVVIMAYTISIVGGILIQAAGIQEGTDEWF